MVHGIPIWLESLIVMIYGLYGCILLFLILAGFINRNLVSESFLEILLNSALIGGPLLLMTTMDSFGFSDTRWIIFLFIQIGLWIVSSIFILRRLSKRDRSSNSTFARV